MMFEHVAEGRECGECRACCEAFEVKEIDKPAGVLCPHHTGTGCGIYDTRPHPCRSYFCLWRRLPAMPDYARPDKSGIIAQIEINKSPRHIFEKVFIVARVESPDVLKTPLGESIIRMLVDQRTLPVWASHGKHRSLLYPIGDFQEAILNPATTPHKHLVQAALDWRKSNGLNATEGIYDSASPPAL
jgi:hypothetical protein